MSGKKGMKHYNADVKEKVRRRHAAGESISTISRAPVVVTTKDGSIIRLPK